MIVRILCAIVLAVFGTFNLHVMSELGYWAFFPPFEHLISTQLFTDLIISISVALLVLARDAREQGRPMWPLALLAVGIVLTGSQAVLLYLIIDPIASRLPRRAPRG
jgi:hypothetical protein